MNDAGAAVTFRNDDWSLSEDGLEHASGYFIGRAVLGARREEGLWDWPLQMAEKRWCRPSQFREAFLAALEAFGLERDAGLGRSFALGFGIRAGPGRAARTGSCRWATCCARPHPRPPARFPRAGPPASRSAPEGDKGYGQGSPRPFPDGRSVGGG